MIVEAEGYLEHADGRYLPRPSLARATILARHVREVERQLVLMHRRIRHLEHALRLERNARKYAVQLLNGRPTPLDNATPPNQRPRSRRRTEVVGGVAPPP